MLSSSWARIFRLLTFPIALLVWAPFDTLLPFPSLRIQAFFGNPILDTAEAGTGIVAFLAGLLTVGASILDLPALRAESLRG